MIGIYHGARVSDYLPTLEGRPFSVWVAEELEDRDWADLAALLARYK